MRRFLFGLVLTLVFVISCSDHAIDNPSTTTGRIPSAITDLAVRDSTLVTISLRWTAPPEVPDSYLVGVAIYHMYCSTDSASVANRDSSVEYAMSGNVAWRPGFFTTSYIYQLQPGQEYFFAVTTENSRGTSPLSNIVRSSTVADSASGIVDPELEQVFRELLNRPTGEITCGDIAEYSNSQSGWWAILSAVSRGIVDLEGIQCAEQTWTFRLSRNRITSLAPLANHWRMRYLDVSYNLLTSVAPLSEPTNLSGLSIRGNPISSLESVLALTQLTSLDISETHINNISSLVALPRLSTLALDATPVTDISPMAQLPELTDVSIAYLHLNDISPLGGATKLMSLWALGNDISDLSPLAGSTDLWRLSISNNQVSDISPLADKPALHHLMADGNQITDLHPLINDTSLEWIQLGGNGLSDIGPLAGLTHITDLYLARNDISDLTALIQNPGLDSGDVIDVSSNPLSETALNVHIPILEARGVTVVHGPSAIEPVTKWPPDDRLPQ